jgi:hypothetical protein
MKIEKEIDKEIDRYRMRKIEKNKDRENER